MTQTRTSSAETEVRRVFSSRIKGVRDRLGYSQEAFAHALGIGPARYNKYEIGRSEAPYEILVKIARVGQVSVDYLLGMKDEPDDARPGSGTHLKSMIKALPTAAVVYDSQNRLFACNRLYRKIFFPEYPEIVRRGVPQDTLVRAWAYANGVHPEETEGFVHKRLHDPPDEGSPTEISVGDYRLQIAESRYEGYRLVLLTDVTAFRSEVEAD